MTAASSFEAKVPMVSVPNWPPLDFDESNGVTVFVVKDRDVEKRLAWPVASGAYVLRT